MKIGFLLRIVEPERQAHRVQRLRAELEAMGHEPVTVGIGELETVASSGKVEVLWRGERLPEYDIFYWSFGWDDIDAWEIIRAVEEAGYKFFMPTTLPLGEKVTQAFLLSKAGVTIPTTQIVSVERLAVVKGSLRYPMVMKGRYGSQGDQVRWVDEFGQIEAFAAEMKIPANDPFVLQEVVQPTGKDVRAFVVGEKVVAAMERTTVKGDFRSNFSLGATVVKTVLNAEEEAAVMKAHMAFGSPVSGVDFMRSENGPVVLEVNMWPGIEGIEKATGVNVAGEMAKLLVGCAL